MSLTEMSARMLASYYADGTFRCLIAQLMAAHSEHITLEEQQS